MTISLSINGETTRIDVDEETPLLWVLRDHLGLTGAKYSCGIGLCGSCKVLLENKPVNACLLRTGDAVGKEITTIEGLAGESRHPVLVAWEELQVPQCGYCQSGQIISAYSLLRDNDTPSDEEIDNAMSGVLCRCGTYPRIRRALHKAAAMMRDKGKRS